jgi:hypothetical protein
VLVAEQPVRETPASKAATLMMPLPNPLMERSRRHEKNPA